MIEKEKSEDEDRIGYSEVNYPNTEILRETFTKVIRYFCQNDYLNNDTTKHYTVLLRKLATFPFTQNKQTKSKQKTKTKIIEPFVLRDNWLILRISILKQLQFSIFGI